MNLVYAFICIVSVNSIIAQNKHVQPIHSIELTNRLNTYAVVIGISDYQDPGIPDLRYADKDAEQFANYLRSDAGGKLDEDHLKVLINQQATMAQFAIALDWLWEVCKEGDQAIIYFSGHGDVEKKSLTQPGFLLCWDAPAKVYMAGGAFALPMLQEVISTLSIQNKAKILIITDACRSGKLAGSSVEGSQATAANLAKQFGNEVKIMSCQPNEYSIEGEQWGGGRGVFSYHLINGLNGLADGNKDRIVTLQEIGRYLEDNVSIEVAPITQVPMIIGNRNERLSFVTDSFMASINSYKKDQNLLLAQIDSRGIEEIVLNNVDTLLREYYRLFKDCLRKRHFFEPPNANAEYYFNKLQSEKSLEKLHSTMRRNYAAALQDDAQQVINKFLRAEIFEVSSSQITKMKKYESYPRQLSKAAELLGKDHYMYNTLQSRRAYFEGFNYIYGGEYNDVIYNKGITLLNESLSFDPNMPLALYGLVFTYGNLKLMTDSALYFAQKANDVSAGWVLPYLKLSDVYSTSHQFDKAKYYLDLVKQYDSGNALLLEVEAYYYFEQKMYAEAEKLILKILEIEPSSICLPCSRNMLVKIYIETKKFDLAEKYALKLLAADSTNFHTRINLGKIYTLTNRIEQAKIEFKAVAQYSAVNTDPNSIYYFWIAYLNANQNKLEEAFQAFETAIQSGYTDYNWMQSDPDTELIRKESERWNKLMKKYFSSHFNK